MEEQTKLFLLNNQNLFSNNYLEHRLPNTALWKEQKEKVSDVFDVIKKAYDETKSLKLGPGEEAGLEDKFIRPVLQALGYEWDVQPTTKRGLKKKRPDYALFKDKTSLTDARKDKDNLARFFKHPVTILEAKYWGRRLNDTEPKDTLDKRDPTAQTVKYLDDVYHASESRIQWAILTNGKHWRLFYYKAASRSGNFFEIDLEEIISREDKEKFLYFYLFFSRDAFIPDSVSGKTWLEQHLKGTEDYAARISTKLKDLIFDKVFEGLAEGFVHYRMSDLSATKETDESKKDIFRGCLTLLYRLLFVLYAESRNLLPVNEDAYYRVSLSKLKRDINNDVSVTGLDKMSRRSYTYWARLQGLFDIIAKGDPALNVPVYNGGLFETPKDSFLSIHKLPDPFLADAIELLTVDHEGIHAPDAPAFIDYSSLSVRHLGDIYEGILEFHIQVAEEDVVEIRKDGKSLWEKASAIKEGIRIYGKRAKGQVYIENSKHERKATGSFYTPHFSVEYIVGNTVGPVLDEKLKIAEGLLSQFAGMQKKSLNNQLSADSIRGYKAKIRELEDEIFKTVFGIKVLDPAMGSGHFLVHTVDYVSDRIIAFLAGYPDNPVIKKIAELRNEILEEISKQGVKIDESKLTEVNLIKRMVMKRCIYGVDLNEMAVELAKLSLWLDSFTLGAPLSFLDHHLKCGNSLIGTNIDALGKALTGRLFAINLEPLKRAIRDMIFVSDLPDATVEQVRESYKKFGEANKGLEGYRILLDMLVAEHFGIPDAKKMLVSDFDKIDLNNLHASIAKLPDKDKKLIEKVEAITGEKRFFHWEIEFPEVFYEQMSGYEQKVQMKNNPGFDCVVGNPPYGLVGEKNYIKTRFTATSHNYDMYSSFIEQSLTLLRKQGFLSFIVPVSWQTGSMFELLRNKLLIECRFNSIVNLPFDVFKDAYIDTSIFVLQKECTENSDIPVLVYEFPKYTKIDTLETVIYSKINQSLWQQTKNKILLNAQAISLITKLTGQNINLLGDLTESARGVLAKPEHILLIREKAAQTFFDGEMFRYEMTLPDKYIVYSEDLPESPASFDFFTGKRVLVRRIVSRQDRIMAHAVTDTFVNKKDIYIFKPKTYLSTNCLLALLNSRLLSYIYFNSDVVAQKDDFRQTTLEGIRNLPIPSISFTTSEKERKEFFREAVKLYKVSKYEDIKKWAEYELAMGRNDTIHDFLAYLAEQMIELNKAKGNEIKGFVKWLEREIGAVIDALTNKTAIKEYHEHNFDHLLEVLKKNKNKFTIDPSGRKTQELFENHFTKSMTILEPLKEKIKATDELIDDIVNKLYKLTDEEIRVVRGAQ